MFASFKAFDSPLRTRTVVASCDFGGHEIWWQVEASTENEALGFLPRFVAERSTACRVADVVIP